MLKLGLKITVNGARPGARVTLKVRLAPAKRKPGQTLTLVGQATTLAKRIGQLRMTVRVRRPATSAVRRAKPGWSLMVSATASGPGLATVTRTMKVRLAR